MNELLGFAAMALLVGGLLYKTLFTKTEAYVRARSNYRRKEK